MIQPEARNLVSCILTLNLIVSSPRQKRYSRYPPPFQKAEWNGLAESDFEKAGEFNGQFTDVFTHTKKKLNIARSLF